MNRARRITQSHIVWRNYGGSHTTQFALGALPYLRWKNQNQGKQGNRPCAVPPLLSKVQKETNIDVVQLKMVPSK